MVTVRVLRVFTDEHGNHGNPLGIVENAATITPGDRQRIATALGYSETVFIDDLATCQIRTFGLHREVPFAGHAAVGAAWFLTQRDGHSPNVLHTAVGEVPVWIEDDLTWVRSTLRTTPPWWHERLDSPEAVEALRLPLSPDQDMLQVWAWEDELAGCMRVRTFARRVGVEEDEACGSGAMRMASTFGRRLTLRHGKGSIIHAKPGGPGLADIGGHVTEETSRTVHLDHGESSSADDRGAR